MPGPATCRCASCMRLTPLGASAAPRRPRWHLGGRKQTSVDDRPPEALLGHYVGIALFLLAVVWIPGTADQFVGPRMVILATLGIGILPLGLIRWLRQPASRAA